MNPLNASSPKSAPSANNLPGAGETLARLGQVRKNIQELVARAQQLDRDFAVRSNKLKSQYEQALSAERARLTQESKAEQADTAAACERIEAAIIRRKNRIAQALENARKTKLAAIESEEGRRTFEIQRGLLDADRVRDTETQTNKTHHDQALDELANELAELDGLTVQARATLGGYRSLAKSITTPVAKATDAPTSAAASIEQLREKRDQVRHELARCRGYVLPLLFRFLPLWLCVVLILGLSFAFVPELRRFDFAAVPLRVWQMVGAALVVVVVLYFLGRKLATPCARAAAQALHAAFHLHDLCVQQVEAAFMTETERIKLTHQSTQQMQNNQWKEVRAAAKTLRSDWQKRLEEQAHRLQTANQTARTHRLAKREQASAEKLQALTEASAARKRELDAVHQESVGKVQQTYEGSWAEIRQQWQHVLLPAYESLVAASTMAREVFPPWQPELWQDFRTPTQFAHAARFAELAVDLEKLSETTIAESKLPLPGAKQLTVPLLLSIPRHASILFETKNSGHEQVIGALNNLVLRLLTSAPPGQLAFTIFDPVGLGQNFAGIMHLADFEERLINSRIWTQQAQFEQRLADLNEHIEKVTQMYLRNEYETLAEYNAQAGRLAEKYHFLVIADFPVNFSEVAVKRLQSIAASGPRCGVHLLIHWDQRKPAPTEFVPEELRKNAVCITTRGAGFGFADVPWDGMQLTLDAPPDPELATQLLQQIGQDSKDSYRVEMPFAEVAPPNGELWSLDTTNELRVPVGRTGATKLQYLALGQGTRQHGLIAGKTGSGKSTLFHVIITNLAVWCSPEQVEFYLVDFKKGVEFKCYATHKLPHARVIAIESDREFGLSVLQRLDEELKRRGDLFRKLGAQDIAGYKRAGGTESMPRVLLLIDEFQELFVEDDRISQGAALLLDRIVRQGRAFGMHVLLGSQTLGGAYSLARATIGQMVVRIALQCNEADAYLIMNEDNPAPRLLSRPGEAIYNDEGGAIQGNSPFQVVWLPDQVRDEWLAKAASLAIDRHIATEPIVFEGNAPANVSDNPMLRSLLKSETLQSTAAPRVWLGAPNAIKGPTEAVFRRQSGSHLLIVGQREEAALAMLITGLISLAVQQPKTGARFLVFDCNPPDSTEARLLEKVAALIPHGVTLVKAGDVEATMQELDAELTRRTESSRADAPATYLFVHALQKNKKLRYDEELSFSMDASAAAGNPGLILNKLLCEGAGLGFHVIATCDTYNNVMRFLSRKALSEFEMRVVFQMSANDSASLIDAPLANNLGLHRAILFNGQEGWTETFRPYALPEATWLAQAGEQLTRLHR